MDAKLSKLVMAMVHYDAPDTLRIQHFMKVHDFAATIGVAEKLDTETQFILEAAAILHDIGIHPAEAKYGNCHGVHQEELGPHEAQILLHKLGDYSETQIERICWLIGHHHTYTNIDSIDYQILIEADFLVNIFEDNLGKETAYNVRNSIFRTKAGIQLLNDMFGLETE